MLRTNRARRPSYTRMPTQVQLEAGFLLVCSSARYLYCAYYYGALYHHSLISADPIVGNNVKPGPRDDPCSRDNSCS